MNENMTAAQLIRLQCAQLLAGLDSQHPRATDWTAEALARDVLLLANAIETGALAASSSG